jgi:hypothetical protein
MVHTPACLGPLSLRDDCMDAGGSAKPGAFAEKNTPPGMEAVDRVGNRRSRIRAAVTLLALTPALSPSPSFPLPQGEGGEPMRACAHSYTLGEKRCALVSGRINNKHTNQHCRFVRWLPKKDTLLRSYCHNQAHHGHKPDKNPLARNSRNAWNFSYSSIRTIRILMHIKASADYRP